MKLIIAGSRDFNDYNRLQEELDLFLDGIENVEIVCGMARGADTLGEKYAKKHKIKIKYFPAQWDLYGKSAGYIRNTLMANYGTHLIAFWDGQSRGTKHMIDLANKNNLEVLVVKY